MKPNKSNLRPAHPKVDEPDKLINPDAAKKKPSEMTTEYRVVLDDGKKIPITATSAGSACETALRSHRDRKVVDCYAGLTASDIGMLRGIDARYDKAMLGIVSFRHEIPSHDAIAATAVEDAPVAPPTPEKMRKLARANVGEFFDDAAIVEASKDSRARFERP